MKQYLINIDSFQGPLDLLLHLIKEKDLDIFQINVSEITNQYLDFLKTMEKLNLDIASEYLVMASYLLEIKSKGLISQNNITEIETEYEVDNRQELIERLVEYQIFKKTTSFFKNQETIRQSIFSRNPKLISTEKLKSLQAKPWTFNFDQLQHQLQEVYKRYQLNKPITSRVSKQQISLEKRCQDILNLLKLNAKKNFSLEEIFLSYNEINLHLLVVTFSAILELVSKQQIFLEQKESFTTITLRYRGEINDRN